MLRNNGGLPGGKAHHGVFTKTVAGIERPYMSKHLIVGPALAVLPNQGHRLMAAGAGHSVAADDLGIGIGGGQDGAGNIVNVLHGAEDFVTGVEIRQSPGDGVVNR